MKQHEQPIDLRRRKDEGNPVVIHHPEENQTDLERWVRRHLGEGPKLWGILGAVVLGAVLLALVLRNLGGVDTTSSEAWNKLFQAKSAEQRVEVAEDFPRSKAAPWAMVQAACENYNEAVDRLPTAIDAAKPLLSKAETQFEDALKEAPKGSIVARRASFGLARTYEARNELDKAVSQYDLIARDWPGSVEASQSLRLASRLRAELKKPEAERFYTKLYAFKPGDVTLPPPGGANAPGGVSAGSILDSLLRDLPPGGGAVPPLPTPKSPTDEVPKPDAEPKAGDEPAKPAPAPTPAPTEPEPAKPGS
ncbi:MAG: hypothetical protein U0800_19880 [Isosphaeraceae bacterium]